jgi:6-phosphogluconolactonase
LNEATGTLELRRTTTGVPNPSYLAFHPQQKFMYAVNELKTFEGKQSGTVSAFAVDPLSGRLDYLNRKLTHGTDPCHVAVDKRGSTVFVANFMSGSVCALPIQADGSLGDAAAVIQHQGNSVDPKRQAGPHAHSTVLDPQDRFAFVSDLGLDRVMCYRLDLAHRSMKPNEIPWLQLKPGAGPRHLAFHPDGQYAYVINELDSTVATAVYDRDQGSFQVVQTLTTLPPEFSGVSTCADIKVSPSGDFVFASNRGHDSLAVFKVDRRTGKLTAVGHQSTGGKTPRSFGIDPTGSYLLVANQSSDCIVTFRIDESRGKLVPVGSVTNVPTPTCVTFARGKE